MVTLFETIEHLHQEELVDFLPTCDRVLGLDGGILISGPIEIGPALLLKEANRSVLHFRRPEHGLLELAKASVLDIRASRATDIKRSHKGFDFRKAISAIDTLGWGAEILHFGPLPIGTWYGNSQFYLWVTRKEPRSVELRQQGQVSCKNRKREALSFQTPDNAIWLKMAHASPIPRLRDDASSSLRRASPFSLRALCPGALHRWGTAASCESRKRDRNVRGKGQPGRERDSL
ncbi:hypothetical protein AB1286_28910 [Trinickia sp. NRRL B-1857]|uniref:hypothetical protein n=1 Tax=Trinickia sp. NRRL B-1857 TaxID=3162879 RepID=UPI003D2AB01C